MPNDTMLYRTCQRYDCNRENGIIRSVELIGYSSQLEMQMNIILLSSAV